MSSPQVAWEKRKQESEQEKRRYPTYWHANVRTRLGREEGPTQVESKDYQKRASAVRDAGHI
jgi:hypothetical protein